MAKKAGRKANTTVSLRVAKLKSRLRQLILMDCYSKDEIFEILVEEFGVSERTIDRVYLSTKGEIIKRMSSLEEEELEKIKRMNLNRLEALIEITFDKNKYGDCIKAIETQNRMVGMNDQNIKLAGELNNNVSFDIKVGDED